MKKISIKGRQFAYEVMGTGSPTVVLETGIGAESSEWGPVAAAIARSRAVFRYDRAGRGESDPSTRQPRCPEHGWRAECTARNHADKRTLPPRRALFWRSPDAPFCERGERQRIRTRPRGIDSSSSVSGAGSCVSSLLALRRPRPCADAGLLDWRLESCKPQPPSI